MSTTLIVSPATYDEIAQALRALNDARVFAGNGLLDMDGIALQRSAKAPVMAFGTAKVDGKDPG